MSETRVVRGAGLFHLPKATYSPQTQALLRDLIQESRLTTLQRKRIEKSVSEGGTLAPPPPPRQRRGAPEAGDDVVLRYFARRRSLQQILQSGAYDRPEYVTRKPCVDKAKEKRKLQNMMAYGKDIAETPRVKPTVTRRRRGEELMTRQDRFQELSGDLLEMVDFLEEMRSLGREKDYRHTVLQDMAAKLREMKQIDGKACERFRKLVDAIAVPQ